MKMMMRTEKARKQIVIMRILMKMETLESSKTLSSP